MNLDELYVTARLAKLDLDEKEAEKLATEVSRMLEYFSVMEKVDVTGLEATVQTLGRENVVRTDIVSSPDVTGKMLENAPQTEDRFIIIPKVL